MDVGQTTSLVDESPAASGLDARAGMTMDRFHERVVEVIDGVLERVASGPLRRIAQEHLATGGKRFRVSVMFDLARAGQVQWEAAVSVAAACELLHNATLIHDDLQDRDRTRRGAPTVWAKHGDDQAINAGDLLLMLPFTALADAPIDSDVKVALMRALSVRAAATACGQSDEQQLLDRMAVTWQDWRRAAAGKTGQIFAFPFEAIALLSGVNAQEARGVGDVALHLGVIFQAVDDVLDLYGDKGRKLPGNDLREGRVSALVCAHLACCPSDSKRLIGLLAMPRELTTPDQVASWSETFVDSGALDWINQKVGAELSAIVGASLPLSVQRPMVRMAEKLAGSLVMTLPVAPTMRRSA